MNEDQVQKAIMLVAMLHKSQELLDELTIRKDFKYNLKYSAKNFSIELEKFLKQFYHNMDEEANIEYNEQLSMFESYLEEIYKGNVEVK